MGTVEMVGWTAAQVLRRWVADATAAVAMAKAQVTTATAAELAKTLVKTELVVVVARAVVKRVDEAIARVTRAKVAKMVEA